MAFAKMRGLSVVGLRGQGIGRFAVLGFGNVLFLGTGDKVTARRFGFALGRELAAKELGGTKVEPEHLALALLSVKSGSCYETLKEFSIDPEYVQALILQAMGLDPEMIPEWF